MYKIYDLECTNSLCDLFQVPDIDVWLTCTEGVLETRNCNTCHKQLGVCIPAPKGYVEYSDNPCKQ